MKYHEAMPALSPADRHALAKIIVEHDGVNYEEALLQIEQLTRDFDDQSLLPKEDNASAPVEY